MQRKLEIIQSTRESKRDIETELKQACEAVIQALDRQLPIPSISQLDGETVEACESAMASAQANLSEALAKNEELLLPYIEASTTRTVLTKPVRGRGEEILEDFAAQLKEKVPNFEASNELLILS